MGKFALFILPTAIFYMTCLSAVADDGSKPRNLILWGCDGTKVSYDLLQSPVVSFTDGVLKISTDEMEVSYPLSAMSRLTYEDKEDSAIENINDGRNEATEIGTLSFDSLPTGTEITVYSIGGVQVMCEEVRPDGTFSLALDALETGIYLVKVNSQIYKIVKQ